MHIYYFPIRSHMLLYPLLSFLDTTRDQGLLSLARPEFSVLDLCPYTVEAVFSGVTVRT